MAQISHRLVETNGIRMHIAEAGAGPLVLMLHGFPESWYSWRHQLHALAEAGYHAVAPDQRGYGQTDRPEAVESYTQLHLVGDVIGLIDALGEQRAVVVGHDWGAPVAWNTALLRPDRVRGVAGLSVTHLPRGGIAPTQVFRRVFGDNFFYMLYFQEPGTAEAELEAHVRDTLLRFMFAASGDAPRGGRDALAAGKQTKLLETMPLPETLPAWLTEADLDFYTAEFERTGFRGPLNWYRNLDRSWELTAAFSGLKVTPPALYIAGDRDPVLGFMPNPLQALEQTVTNLRNGLMLPGCGHWTQQERPEEVNAALLEFLSGLP
jgi:pimeloyl-ACP methyl ester carboxylesterase